MSDVLLYLPVCSETTRACTVLPRQDRITIAHDLITYLKALQFSLPLFVFSFLLPPANSEGLQHYGLLFFSSRDNDGCERSVAVEMVRTCTDRGKQFKVCCGVKLRHAGSFGFTHRLASVSSKFNTFSHTFPERVWVPEWGKAVFGRHAVCHGSMWCWSITHCRCASASSTHWTCINIMYINGL